MKKETHKLLEEAHSVIVNATGTDVPKSQRAEAYKKARAIYKKVKDIEIAIWNILNEDDNHKTTK